MVLDGIWPIWPLQIKCIVLIPPVRIRALQNELNPSSCWVTLLTARWSYSTMLFRYLFCRIRMSTQASAFTLSVAAVLAPLLSIVIFSGTSCRLMARSRKRRAAALSRFGCEKKVNRITGAINCPVKVLPLARDFDVGLVHAPTPTKGSLAPAKGGRHFRQNFDCPLMYGEVVYENGALLHHLLDGRRLNG